MINKKSNLEIKLNQHLIPVFNEILPFLADAGIKYWVFGGIGVSVIAGKFIRENKDVDTYVLSSDFEKVKNLLRRLCDIHNLANKNIWRLEYPSIYTGKPLKIDLYIRGIQRFSVIPIYEINDDVQLVIEMPKHEAVGGVGSVTVPSRALIQKWRIIDGFGFFSAPKDIIIELFKICIEQRIKYFDKKYFDDISRIMGDARIIYSREEFNEISNKFNDKNKFLLDIELIKKIICRIIIFFLEKIKNVIIFHLETNSTKPIPYKTFEQYLLTRKTKGFGFIKDIIRYIQLRLKGIKKPGRLLMFINYLEDYGKNSISKFTILSKSILEERNTKLKAQGLEVGIFFSVNKFNDILCGQNKVPFYFDMKLAEEIYELFNLKTNSVQMFRLLHTVGYFPKEYSSYYFFKEFKDNIVYTSMEDKQIFQHELLNIFNKYQNVPQIQDFIIQNIKIIELIPIEKVEIFIDLSNRINNSSLLEMKHLKDSLLIQLLKSNNPVENYKKIEVIFGKSNVSLANKLIKISEILYVFGELEQKNKLCFFEDLLEIHFKSNNSSFKKDVDELSLQKMKNIKYLADKHNRHIFFNTKKESSDEEFFLKIEAGDFLKGINIKYINNIFQNGCVAGEFLGDNSNNVPFSVDVSLAKEEKIKNGIKYVINDSFLRNKYDVLFVLKNRGQYQINTTMQSTIDSSEKIQLFYIGTFSDDHYGIRTGFPAIEISFIIVMDEYLLLNFKEIEQIFFEIAKNGYYIPITNESGKVIFTPEMYDIYCKAFVGLEKFDVKKIVFLPTTVEQKSYNEISKIVDAIPKNMENVNSLTQTVVSEIKRIFEELGVSFKSDLDAYTSGAEFSTVGSTGRHTNNIEDFDLDFSIKLNSIDFVRTTELVFEFESNVSFVKEYFYKTIDEYYQLILTGVTSIGNQKFNNPVDIDISFVNKSILSQYTSQDAVSDRLNYVMDNYGEFSYKQAIANIIFAKQILKRANTYKYSLNGGLSGIGVEDWILNNGCNTEEAFKSFYDTAHEDGKRLSFDIFKKKYQILDAGMDHILCRHRDHIKMLKPNGYEAMLDIIEKYFNDK